MYRTKYNKILLCLLHIRQLSHKWIIIRMVSLYLYHLHRSMDIFAIVQKKSFLIQSKLTLCSCARNVGNSHTQKSYVAYVTRHPCQWGLLPKVIVKVRYCTFTVTSILTYILLPTAAQALLHTLYNSLFHTLHQPCSLNTFSTLRHCVEGFEVHKRGSL